MFTQRELISVLKYAIERPSIYMQHAEEFIYTSVYPVANLFSVLLCAIYVTECPIYMQTSWEELLYLRMQDKLSVNWQ